RRWKPDSRGWWGIIGWRCVRRRRSQRRPGIEENPFPLFLETVFAGEDAPQDPKLHPPAGPPDRHAAFRGDAGIARLGGAANLSRLGQQAGNFRTPGQDARILLEDAAAVDPGALGEEREVGGDRVGTEAVGAPQAGGNRGAHVLFFFDPDLAAERREVASEPADAVDRKAVERDHMRAAMQARRL